MHLIYRGKPPAPPEDSPRFDLCGGRGGLYGGWASTDVATEWSMQERLRLNMAQPVCRVAANGFEGAFEASPNKPPALPVVV